jgi:aspartate ammonia-lyase
MTNDMQTDRIENDPLGAVSIPIDAYYGPQTARAIANFPISGIRISQFPNFIKALAFVKMAAARANAAFGDLDKQKADAICQVCEEIAAGKHLGEFPLDVFQGGAGTSTNMNINEVIANRGLEIMGLPRGKYDKLHPNNDVNLAQSTNDVYPRRSALRSFFHAGHCNELWSRSRTSWRPRPKTFRTSSSLVGHSCRALSR